MKKKFEVYDHPTRYTMPSSKKGQVHLIDLAANNFHGECSCENFQCVQMPRMQKAIDEGYEPMFPDEFRCKHLILIREQVTTIFIAALNATTEISPKPTPNNE
jgi:hypothetical protein